MHDRVYGNELLLCLPVIVGNEREAAEHVTTNPRVGEARLVAEKKLKSWETWAYADQELAASFA